MAQFGPDIDEESFGEEEAFSEFDENNIPDFGDDEDDSLIGANDFAAMDGFDPSMMPPEGGYVKEKGLRQIEFT